MKVIEYKNKKLKLPYDLAAGETSTEMVTRQNPFSGQSIELPEFAAVIYDKTIELNLKAERKDSATGQPPGISEHQDDWQLVRNGINLTVLRKRIYGPVRLMKFITVSIKEIQADKTHRLDAKYWIKKKKKRKQQASNKLDSLSQR